MRRKAKRGARRAPARYDPKKDTSLWTHYYPNEEVWRAAWASLFQAGDALRQIREEGVENEVPGAIAMIEHALVIAEWLLFDDLWTHLDGSSVPARRKPYGDT